jgi:hypothetical protein
MTMKQRNVDDEIIILTILMIAIIALLLGLN